DRPGPAPFGGPRFRGMMCALQSNLEAAAGRYRRETGTPTTTAGVQAMSMRSGVEEAAQAVQQGQFLERTLFEQRTLTLFGEIDMDVARRTTEKLLALAHASDD